MIKDFGIEPEVVSKKFDISLELILDRLKREND